MKIGIVGAGIGGLTAAIMLAEQGHRIEIFDKADALREVGAGIGIGENVLKKLGQHDLAKGIKNAGQILEKMRVFDEYGESLTEIKLSQKSTNVALLRQALLDILVSYIPAGIIHLQHEVIKAEVQNDHVLLHFHHQDSKSFDLVVGADGIHSKVRQVINPKSKVKYQGYTCFRGVVEGIDDLSQIADEYWGKKGRFGIVSLLNGQAYWFATMNAKEKDAQFSGFNKPYLQAYFNHYPEPVRKILDLQSETGILHHDIYDLKPLNTFVYQNRIVLIGDAAHATTPNMGQGAGQAMEDAIVLANVLQKYESVTEALKRYDRLRVKHTAKVIKRSRKIGKIAQKEHRLSIQLRNRVLKRLPKWLVALQTSFLFKSKSE
ncbi:hypothetical protein DOS71_11400 [Staphylococcus felis]|uniref:FAD-dependent monooxygenase n=1 Tax=Staphylococcus felis TaxID=46127 RepID=UPI000E287507|nr:FAD-dependent monooxygenase [Staphylococcus felis]REI07157.1 hypothetical protein DOS71_11400 [Staphylococcus felis]